jgi:parvulin-like peptidyl-prolyl isomerase
MSPAKAKPAAPFEPDPRAWLTPERCDQLQQQLGASSPLLRQGGLWRAALGYWVRWQASLEADWPAEQEQAVLAELEQQWFAKHSLAEAGLSGAELRAKLRVGPAVARWSRQQWGHRLESLYLQRKSLLDRASCRLLRLRDKNLALELYHRIKAVETSFEQAAQEFGEGPERHQGGLIPLQPLERMPFGLAPLLQRLEPGRLSMPLRLDKGFCLVQLESFQPSQLDPATEELLLAEQLQLWVEAVLDQLVAALGSGNDLNQSSVLDSQH